MTMLSELVLDLLEQDEVWQGSDGEPVSLDELSLRRRTSVLAMLEARAEVDYSAWVEMLICEGADDEELALAGAVAADPETGRHDPEWVHAWFEDRPLIRRLRELDLPPPGGRS